MLGVREKSERQSKSEEVMREREPAWAERAWEKFVGYRFFFFSFFTLQNIVILLIK